MTTADLTYRFDGNWYHLLPQNEQAENAWRLIAASFDSGVVPVSAWASVWAQLRHAGYSVRKAGAGAVKHAISDDDLLAELAA